jgi:hypothetical protein
MSYKNTTIKKGMIVIAALMPSVGFGLDCDCQKIVGTCMASIEFVKSFGSKPSYGAEIIVHSLERTCSKVEYYVDSTPHQTVLVSQQSEPESLFGTSPIIEKNVKLSSCKICAATLSKNTGTSSLNSKAENLAGNWRIDVPCPWASVTDQIVLTPNGNGDNYSISGAVGNGKITNGEIRGQQVRIETQHWWNSAVYVGTLTSPTNMAGTMSQEANNPVCNWTATKQ